MKQLTAPVGKGQANLAVDVREVQRLLDAYHVDRGRGRMVRIDGRFGALTAAAIDQFQRDAVGLQKPDGVIDPGGRTWRRLALQDAKSGLGQAGVDAAPDPHAELIYLAKTLYGEAAGQSYESKLAVGWSIRNRLASGRWGRTYRAVVTARLQYTCWSKHADPGNYARIQNPKGSAWLECLKAANEIINADADANLIPDATHYYSPYAQAALHKVNPQLYPETPGFTAPPAQLVPNPPGVSDDDFHFYKNVR
jgi:hypothetical protein